MLVQFQPCNFWWLLVAFEGNRGTFTMPGEQEDPLLRWFEYEHLPDDLRETSKLFHKTAMEIVSRLRPSAERTVALRKLLEGKDAAVRAAILGR